MTKSGSDDWVPDQGDLVAINFDPRLGHEQAGRRPALVLSAMIYNGRSGLAVFAPITNQIKGYPFEVLLPAGLQVGGVVLADQLKSLDWRARKAQFISTVPPDVLTKVLQKAAVLLSSRV
ncbi:MAG: endoribonuclease MazF [Acidobacteria bacterium]|nr:endoribonuclease MazF [Acidobacteriota bacterium]MBV9068717.1 endoribonuclease MazF [Acidobacteriota bacterium]MBV9188098.1 endoribonuclease MazF [Acidobacteriota bacterium]